MPHHVTQRGNRRENVFFNDEDRAAYLKWLGEYAAARRVGIAAYCLMSNHVHLILIPATGDGLQEVLKPLHMRYAQRVNRAHGQQGHVWQGRYFSSVLDEDYFRAALRYVELNPVRARMVEKAEDYRWSSARGHCGLARDPLLSAQGAWRSAFKDIPDWARWLAEPEAEDALLVLRRNAVMGLPCGAEGFIGKIEKLAGRALRYRPQGRPGRRGARMAAQKKGSVPFSTRKTGREDGRGGKG